MQVLLDFLAYMSDNDQSLLATCDPLVFGAVRLLGRILAEAPDIHEEHVMRLLPFILQVNCELARLLGHGSCATTTSLQIAT